MTTVSTYGCHGEPVRVHVIVGCSASIAGADIRPTATPSVRRSNYHRPIDITGSGNSELRLRVKRIRLSSGCRRRERHRDTQRHIETHVDTQRHTETYRDTQTQIPEKTQRMTTDDDRLTHTDNDVQ